MKKIILLFAFLIFLTAFSSAHEQNISYKYIGTGKNIKVINYKIEPYPVSPGEKFIGYFLVKNLGAKVDKVVCRIIEKYPFRTYKENQKEIGKLESGEEYRFSFEILIDGNALETTENLEITCSDNLQSPIWFLQEIPIKIRRRYATFNINSVKTIPEILEIGKRGILEIDITNNAGSIIRDLLTEIDITNVPIAPSSTTTIKRIQTLNAEENTKLQFEILVLPEAAPGIYKMPLRINYTNAEGTQQSFSTVVTLTINEEPTYYIIIDSIKNLNNGLTEITLKFVNNGKTDLNFFDVKIENTKEITVKENSQIYIGDLDSDDYTTESFTAKISGNVIEIPLKITYRDSLNNFYNVEKKVILDREKVKNKSEPNRFITLVISLPILIILIASYYFYKRRKNKF